MSFKDEMKAALDTFIVESRELLQQMEEALLGLEQAEEVAEAIDAIFRTVHTIKGTCGFLGLPPAGGPGRIQRGSIVPTPANSW